SSAELNSGSPRMKCEPPPPCWPPAPTAVRPPPPRPLACTLTFSPNDGAKPVKELDLLVLLPLACEPFAPGWGGTFVVATTDLSCRRYESVGSPVLHVPCRRHEGT